MIPGPSRRCRDVDEDTHMRIKIKKKKEVRKKVYFSTYIHTLTHTSVQIPTMKYEGGKKK